MGVRAYLPTLLQQKVNTALASLEGPFCGHVGDFDLHLIRGAYAVQNVEIFSRAGEGKKCNQKIFSADQIDMSISWSQLFRGRARLDVELSRPSLALDTLTTTLQNSKKEKPSTNAAKGTENVWATLVPWRIDSLIMENGEVFYDVIGKDETKPVLSHLDGRVTGIEGGKRANKPILFTVRGNALESSLMLATGSLDLAGKTARWDVDVSAERVDLSQANPLLLRRVPLSFTKGLLDTYGEFKGEGANLRGYVKLLFSDIDVVASGEDWKGFKHGVMEVLNSVVFGLMKSPKVESTGTILSFRKDASGFQMDIGGAVGRAIEHRLGDPVKKGIENRYSLDQG